MHSAPFSFLFGGRILVQQCLEFGAVNCHKKRGIFIRIILFRIILFCLHSVLRIC